MADAAPDITVLVATRNRAHELSHLLESLARQETVGRFTYDVLIADNGSTDGTRALVERLRAGYPVPLRYLYEARAGKSWALNAGLAQAAGALIAFTDDDVEAEPGWLAALWRCFAETGADAVGGKIVPRFTGGRPEWVSDAFVFGALGCVDHGAERLISTAERYYYWVGGNAAIRRAVAQSLGGYSVHMTRGQDTEFGLRCVQRGKRLVYEPSAVTRHRIGPDRLTPAFFRRWWHQRGHYRAFRAPWRPVHLVTVMPMSWYGETLRRLLQWLAAMLTRQPMGERLLREVRLRERGSEWAQRVRLLPAMWRVAATRGVGAFAAGPSYADAYPEIS
jgi:glycosyltransferase involved in cell wall biosynthesis